MTSPIPPPPEVYALTWQGYVAHIVRMVSRIAMPFDQFRHALCECHMFSLFIVYVNYPTPSCLATYMMPG